MIETLAMLGAFALGTGVVRTWQRFVAANTVLAYRCEAMTAEIVAAVGCPKCRAIRTATEWRVTLCHDHWLAARKP